MKQYILDLIDADINYSQHWYNYHKKMDPIYCDKKHWKQKLKEGKQHRKSFLKLIEKNESNP